MNELPRCLRRGSSLNKFLKKRGASYEEKTHGDDKTNFQGFGFCYQSGAHHRNDLCHHFLCKTAQEIDAEVNAALEFFLQHVKGGKDFLNAAKGVLILHNIVKVGVGVGGEYGEGAMRIGGKTVEYYSISAGSVGLQIGAQKKNLILVFKQNDALNHFRKSSGWKVGGGRVSGLY